MTGATGFVGKCLVEKLLRDCCDIETIYIMIRAKKGQTATERRDEYVEHLVFGVLRAQQPQRLAKIQVVEGDLMAADLAMSATQRQQMADNVSVIFHCAADVRFDRPLYEAFHANVLGTQRVLQFAKEVRQLDVRATTATLWPSIKLSFWVDEKTKRNFLWLSIFFPGKLEEIY